ncbi:MAG: hypothetical protein ABIH11_02105 [Candidatus Altiarchaeota archaeon]
MRNEPPARKHDTPLEYIPEAVRSEEVYPGIKRGFLLTGGGTLVYGLRIRATREEYEGVREGLGDVGVEFHDSRHGGYIQVSCSGFIRVDRPESKIIETANMAALKILGKLESDSR